MGRGALWATVHGVAKELDTTYRLNSNNQLKVKNREVVSVSPVCCGDPGTGSCGHCPAQPQESVLC